VVPSANEPNMIERWEIDLSPGVITSPRKLRRDEGAVNAHAHLVRGEA